MAPMLLLAAVLVATPSRLPDTPTPPPCGKGPVTIVVAFEDWCPVATQTPRPMIRDGQVYRRATPVPTPTPDGRPTPACEIFGYPLPQCVEPCENTRTERWTDWPECGGRLMSWGGEW